MPDGLTQPEQWLYLSLRALYREYRSGAVSKEQAAQEKRAILDQYELADMSYRVYKEASDRANQYSAILTEAEKSGCEICKKIVKIFDGRETK
ncbi:MAG TPA: hypothetical protein DEP23_09490 [Ruminococcaceae bacterium]|nr:hypothetical protein [Oscillospiraceae bacterium]